MKKPCISLLLMSLISLPLAAGDLHRAQCTAVIDGDTLVIQTETEGRPQGGKIKINLEGIDAPELDQNYGTEARDLLAKLVTGQEISYEIIDGNTIPPQARVQLGGNNLSLELLSAGLAWIRKTENEDFAVASITARSSRKGLWNDTRPIPPWIWRNRKPTSTPVPTHPPAIRSLSAIASQTELEKNAEGKTIIAGLPQKRPEDEEETKAENTSASQHFHEDFSCPKNGLETCAEEHFRSSYEKASGAEPGPTAKSEETSAGGGHLFIFTGSAFSVPVACQCPDENDCSCSIDLTLQKKTSESDQPEETETPEESTGTDD